MFGVVGVTVLALVLFTVSVHAGDDSSLEDCLKKDSVSCVRDEIFRSLKTYFGPGGVGFLEEVFSGKEVDSEDDEVREEGATSAKKGRGGVLDSEDTTERFASEINGSEGSSEGRGKKLKKMLPFLLLIKMQYFIYGVIAYVIVALITKAALLKSSLALLIAGVLVLRKLLHPGHHQHVLTRHQVQVTHHEVPSSSYNVHPAQYQQEQHADYSQNIAYRGQNHMNGRR